MSGDVPFEVHTALQLIRSGRFAQALQFLEQRMPPLGRLERRADARLHSIYADVLQRVGQNDRAEAIATQTLQANSLLPQLGARCHFVLGNVYRDRGNTARAVEHLQTATTPSLAANDVELYCWAQLRLMVVLAELSGTHTAIARIGEVKRALTASGDARPFAGLHLWLAEVESMRGNLEQARQHLKTADALLSAVDDVWLLGYLAINNSAVHYYGAEIPEAKRWAKVATDCSEQSGHRATRRAAYANLGSIEFALGNYDRAEECFSVSLSCCEPGSIHRVAILDNMAQIRLQSDDLDGCKELISQLDALIEHNDFAKRRHYNAYALQTKIRLLLRQGKNLQALEITNAINHSLHGLPQARVGAETHLLSIEALLANNQLFPAVEGLRSVFSAVNPLTPDLLARFEQISGRTLASAGAHELARVHLERAAQCFKTLGHCCSEERARAELSLLPGAMTAGFEQPVSAHQRSLDRVRALMDLRRRPELFGHEAMSLLKELECTFWIDLVVDDGSQRRSIRHSSGDHDRNVTTAPMSIVFSAKSHRTVSLTLLPRNDARSKVAAFNFHRLLNEILAIDRNPPAFADDEIIWTATDGVATRHGVVFHSESMLGIFRMIKQVAPLDISVLVTGETGTGKEVIAKTVHDYSHRSKMPFLALNCAAVPKDLIESQLFGHRKGAFSGAAENHPGIVRAANGGTLFLDEIGELPLDMQAKLLRFLEMSEVHPVGESHPVKVNVRLIFATNGDLEEAVSQNRFRQDLYYRLNVIPIKVPPLRERREEIPVLANLFAQRFAAEFGKDAIRFSAAAMEQLIVYSWPGNIRQLANEVRRLAALTESGACIEPDDLSPQVRPQGRPDTAGVESAPQLFVRINQPLDKATAQLEAEMIKHALRQAGGRISDAASALGISRKGLYLKRLRLGLTDFGERAH